MYDGRLIVDRRLNFGSPLSFNKLSPSFTASCSLHPSQSMTEHAAYEQPALIWRLGRPGSAVISMAETKSPEKRGGVREPLQLSTRSAE
jgi:hypothetical protein